MLMGMIYSSAAACPLQLRLYISPCKFDRRQHSYGDGLVSIRDGMGGLCSRSRGGRRDRGGSCHRRGSVPPVQSASSSRSVGPGVPLKGTAGRQSVAGVGFAGRIRCDQDGGARGHAVQCRDTRLAGDSSYSADLVANGRSRGTLALAGFFKIRRGRLRGMSSPKIIVVERVGFIPKTTFRLMAPHRHK